MTRRTGGRGFSSASPLPSKHERRRGSAPRLRGPSRKQRLERVTLSRLLQVDRRHGTLEDLAQIAALCNLMDGGGGAQGCVFEALGLFHADTFQ